MTKKELHKEYIAMRQKIKDATAALKKTKDSKEKFEKLIKVTSDFESYVTDTQLKGLTYASAHPYSSQKWIDAYYEFVNRPKTKTKVKKKTPSKHIKQTYNIMLCWTIKPDYCVCESIIEKIQKYFESIKVASHDTTWTEFPDRIEFCETYKLNCTKEQYQLILRSAEYILDITTDSAYDKCNMGIFGKEA